MAIIKVTNSKGTLSGAINYITQEGKTEEQLISGKDCMPESATDEMKATKEQFNKTEGRQYYHYVQSFSKEENITPQKAHEIALEWAEKNFKGYEVLIATHKDREHIHSHLIVNSVSFEDGRKYHTSKHDLEELKKDSDRICEREGLSIIKEPSKDITTFSHDKYKVLEKAMTGQGKSYVLQTGLDVSNSLKKCITKDDFIKDMESKGYKINWNDTRKHITFTTPTGEKVRNSNLEKTFKQDKFSKGGMEYELQCNRARAEQERVTGTSYTTDVDWSAVRDNVQSEENRVPEQLGNEVTRAIQQKVRAVEERTKRTIGESRTEDKSVTNEQRPVKTINKSRDFELDR